MRVDLQTGSIVFRTTGLKIKYPGFIKLYIEGTDEQLQKKMVLMLADLKEGDEFISMELDSKQHFTRPSAPMPLFWIQFKREIM